MYVKGKRKKQPLRVVKGKSYKKVVEKKKTQLAARPSIIHGREGKS